MPKSRATAADRQVTASALGERLRGLRQERSRREGRVLSQGEVGAAVGIDAPRMNNYERGEKIPRAPLLAKLAAFYGVTLDYLVAGIIASRPSSAGEKDPEADALAAQIRALPPDARAVVRQLVATLGSNAPKIHPSRRKATRRR